MVTGWQQVVLVGAAVLFVAFLVLRMLPGRPRRGVFHAEVRAARERARRAPTPRARAEAFRDAGTLAARNGARWASATGLFLRSMNSDPTWPEAVQQLVQSFRGRRPRLLEAILWNRLSRLPWDDAHRLVLREIVSALTLLYEHALRDRSRAEVMRRLSKSFT